MMQVFEELVGFAGKGLVVLVVVAACALLLMRVLRATRRGTPEGGQLRVRRLDRQLERGGEQLRAASLPPKQRKQQLRRAAKRHAKEPARGRTVFVLDFKGDIMASAVESLRHEVTALLAAAQREDEVVLRLESPGGAASSYGLAASQLARLTTAGLELTVCVDRVAASGGYLIACVAQKILAAPFAVLGSIGVAAPVPNLHRLLDRHGVDFHSFTAGRYKRTVSLFGEMEEEGRRKFQEQLDEVHALFKQFVGEHRPALDIDAVATGEHWLGERARELGLVDEIMTSDDYLMRQLERANVLQLSYRRPRRLRERLTGLGAAGARALLAGLAARLARRELG